VLLLWVIVEKLTLVCLFVFQFTFGIHCAMDIVLDWLNSGILEELQR